MTDALTMDVLRKMMDAMNSIPPPPIFASSEDYPRDGFWTFERKGREYVIGHPDLWAKVPQETRPRKFGGFDLGAIRIRNTDNPNEWELRSEIWFHVKTAYRRPGDPPQWPKSVIVRTAGMS